MTRLRSPYDAIVIAGLTATGKTDASLSLADLFAAHGQTAEIVNADALQFYRGMDIGTAKLSSEQRQQHPHHLFDFLEIHEQASVAEFQRLARDTIEAIQGRNAVPIIVGGSGLYLSAIFSDFEFPPNDPALRETLLAQASTPAGFQQLQDELKRLSPGSKDHIDFKNPRRVIRALEIRILTGKDAYLNRPEAASIWQNSTLFFLDGDREKIKQRITLRAQSMFEEGLLDEVAALREKGLSTNSTAGQAIGYAQAIRVLDREITKEQAIQETAQLTHRFARRQRSWFNRHQEKIVLDYEQKHLAQTMYDTVQAQTETR